jgi:hypothetical protein
MREPLCRTTTQVRKATLPARAQLAQLSKMRTEQSNQPIAKLPSIALHRGHTKTFPVSDTRSATIRTYDHDPSSPLQKPAIIQFTLVPTHEQPDGCDNSSRFSVLGVLFR